MTHDQNGLELKNLLLSVADLTLTAHFKVRPGERLALFGPSGAGKTTLLRAIAGLHPIGAGGEIWLAGRRIDAEPPEARGIGLVFQDQALFTRLTVLENATFGLLARQRGARAIPTRREAEEKARDGLARVGLADRLGTPVDRLSGGERQRLALIRALIWEPQALLLDEPFSALDADTRQTTIELLQQLLGAAGPIPVILVTHRKSDCDGWVDRSIELDLRPGQAQREGSERVCVDRMPRN